MARTIQEIQEEIKLKIRTYPELNNFLFPEDGGSQVSVFNLIIFVVSSAIFTFEVIADSLKNDITLLRDSAIVGSAAYIRQLMFNFQLGDSVVINTTDPDDPYYFVPRYDPVTPANRIVTQCAVTSSANNSVIIKVAKNSPPEPLSAAELTALQDYYFGNSGSQGVGFAGVNASFVSVDPDRLRVEANVYFQGQFVEATTKAAVVLAMQTFLSSFTDENFGGTILIAQLRNAIEAVEGVTRAEFILIEARASSQTFAERQPVDDQGSYATIAGYAIEEDEVGHTFNDTITMIQETA